MRAHESHCQKKQPHISARPRLLPFEGLPHTKAMPGMASHHSTGVAAVVDP